MVLGGYHVFISSHEQLSQEQRKIAKKALACRISGRSILRGYVDLPEFCELWPIHRDCTRYA